MDAHERPDRGEEPEATAGELARRCGRCRAEVAHDFFTLHGLSVCPACAEEIRQQQAGPGNPRRGLRFGAGAAAIVALCWCVAAAVTGRQLSYVGVLAGVAIGWAVQRGSRRQGGFRCQLIAVLLVYAAFVARLVPPVFGGIADAIKQERVGQVVETRTVASGTATATATATATSKAKTMVVAPRASWWATAKAYLVFTVIAWGLVLASPFLPGTTSVLSLLWLTSGMVVAVLLNRRLPLRGPFRA